MTKTVKFQIHHNKDNVLILDTSSEEDPDHYNQSEEESSCDSHVEVDQDKIKGLYNSPNLRKETIGPDDVPHKKRNKLLEGMMSLKQRVLEKKQMIE